MCFNYNDKIFSYDLFENFIFSISPIIQGLLSRPSSNGWFKEFEESVTKNLRSVIFSTVWRTNFTWGVYRGSNLFHTHASETSHEFQTLGSRGPNGQSSVSFLDPKTGILFYALTNLNTIACWRPQDKFTMQQQGYVYQDNVTMVFPNDLKVIANLSNCQDPLSINCP